MRAQNLGDRIFFDLSAQLKLRVTGADRARFLNGQITNDIRKATKTATVEACVLNAKGKMEAHIFVHADGDAFLVDADAALESILQHRLERYIIADDVQIEDVSTQLSIFHVIGGDAPSEVQSEQIVSADRFRRLGQDIWCESMRHDEIKTLLSKDFRFCDEQCAEHFRIEQGLPRWGRELTSEIIPVEANLEQRCIDYEKGCYIGQETISRMKMSGQRNKQLCGLVSLNGVALAAGMRLRAAPEEKDAGWVTSAARVAEREIGLGYARRGFNSAGTKLQAMSDANGQTLVEVVDLPFSA
jgi:tRNA-modifying protein YgfZ